MAETVIGQTRVRTKTNLNAAVQRKNFRRNNFFGDLFIYPCLLVFMLFTLIPMAISLGLAFTDYDILSDDLNYVDTDNFERMFQDDRRYENSVRSTFKYVFFSVPLR